MLSAGTLLLFALSIALAQIPVPSTYPGFSLGSPSAPVVIEMFYDILCPYCRKAWPHMEDVYRHYGSTNVRMVFHTFPLPYHDNSYFANWASHSLAETSVDQALAFSPLVYAVQETLGSDITANLTRYEVKGKLVEIAYQGGLDGQAVENGFKDPSVERKTRTAWDFACERGVWGTPTFYVNGVRAAAQSSWDLAKWREFLDPLLETKAISQA